MESAPGEASLLPPKARMFIAPPTWSHLPDVPTSLRVQWNYPQSRLGRRLGDRVFKVKELLSHRGRFHSQAADFRATFFPGPPVSARFRPTLPVSGPKG